MMTQAAHTTLTPLPQTQQTDRRLSSVLELLHPNGSINRSVVIGAGCPFSLAPVSHTLSDTFDLIVLAPTMAECETNDWLDATASPIIEKLSQDGLAYVLASPTHRRAIVRFLESHSLAIELALLHYPDWSKSRYLIPLEFTPFDYAFGTLIQTNRVRRSIARLALTNFWGTAWLNVPLPSAGLVARRRGARQICNWLFQPDVDHAHDGTFLLQSSWRGAQDGGVVVYTFQDKDKQPVQVVKVPATTWQESNHVREAKNLTELAPSARQARVSVPHLVGLEALGERTILRETAQQGQALSTLIAQHPERLSNIMEQLADWLICWNQRTKRVRQLSSEDLSRAILDPAQIVTPGGEQDDTYFDWLRDRCHECIGMEMPFVAAHNDLTLANIVQAKDGRFGILDWEAADQIHFPLTDFMYLYVDAVSTTQHHASRLKAFESCFTSSGLNTAHFKQQQQRIMEAIDFPTELYDLCLHACWLHHAANEARDPTVRTRPFLEIVQWLARNYRNLVNLSFR